MRSRSPMTRVAAAVLVALPLVLPAAGDAGLEGHWEGAIDAPGMKLEINIDFQGGGAAPKGDISIPVQGVKDMPFANIILAGKHATFDLPGVPGNATFAGDLSEDGKALDGQFSQGGMQMPFHLKAAAAPEVSAAQAFTDFDSIADKIITDFRVPGAAVGVVKDGKLVISKGYGLRDVEKKLPVTPQTLFPIGSATKAFTVFVLGTLVDEGKIAWDEPASKYIPDLRFQDDYLTTHLTVRDMVTHRSGLPRHDLVWYNNGEPSRKEMVFRLRYLEANRGLREEFQYNNLMFLTAGYMSECLTGKPWEDNVRERILGPLGMTHTNFATADSQKTDDFAQPYREDDGKVIRTQFRDLPNIGPAGSINSCVEDLAHWVKLQLGDGTFDGHSLLSGPTLDDMHTPHMAIAEMPRKPEVGASSYGMGWFIDSYRGHYRAHHGGNIDGFSALIVLYPKDGAGVIVLTNQTNTPVTGILARYAADRILGLETRDWMTEPLAKKAKGEEVDKQAKEKKQAVRKKGTSPSHPIADYVGDYENPGYGVLAITMEGARLGMKFNGITAPLEHWHFDVFNALKNPDDPTFEDAKLTFALDDKGEVASLSTLMEPAVKEIVFARKGDRKLSDPAYLARFAGKYMIEDQPATFALKGTTLTCSIPGQPTYELVPGSHDSFTLNGMAGFSVRFVANEKGEVTEAEFDQPNGVFTAKRQ